MKVLVAYAGTPLDLIEVMVGKTVGVHTYVFGFPVATELKSRHHLAGKQ